MNSAERTKQLPRESVRDVLESLRQAADLFAVIQARIDAVESETSQVHTLAMQK
jgi:hypothetical protein